MLFPLQDFRGNENPLINIKYEFNLNLFSDQKCDVLYGYGIQTVERTVGKLLSKPMSQMIIFLSHYTLQFM